MPLLSIIIPAYNEPMIGELIGRLIKVGFPVEREIIVVDDGSTDGTRAWIERNAPLLGIRTARLSKNSGKGAALMAGFDLSKGDVCVVQDADLEYDPRELIDVVMPIFNGVTKVCYGSRHLSKIEHLKNKSWAVENGLKYHIAHYGGRIVTAFCNFLFRSHLTDEPTCYKAFDAEFLKDLVLKSNGFELEAELTAKTLKRTSILEVPIHYSPRRYEEGKKIGWRDGFMAILTLLKYRFSN